MMNHYRRFFVMIGASFHRDVHIDVRDGERFWPIDNFCLTLYSTTGFRMTLPGENYSKVSKEKL